MATTQYEGVLTYVDEHGNTNELYPDIKTDASLSIEGKAADAKAVGEKLKSAGSQPITQAEWDALPDSKYTDGIMYVITDADDMTAKNMPYDGSVTGLGNDVQEAIDNLNAKAGSGGGGTAGVRNVKVTQEEYDALPDSKNSDNVIYTITDGNEYELPASSITYADTDGNESTVQVELDSLNESLNAVNGKLGGLSFGTDGEGNYGYFGADGSLIPFSSGVITTIVEAWNAKSSNTLASDATIDQIIEAINSASIFSTGSKIVIYGTDANTNICPSWSGSKSVSASNTYSDSSSGKTSSGTFETSTTIQFSNVDSVAVTYSFSGSRGSNSSYYGTFTNTLTIDILDYTGNIVATNSVSKTNTSQNTVLSVNTESLENGKYTIRLTLKAYAKRGDSNHSASSSTSVSLVQLIV